jgi:hypothetical protein
VLLTFQAFVCFLRGGIIKLKILGIISRNPSFKILDSILQDMIWFPTNDTYTAITCGTAALQRNTHGRAGPLTVNILLQSDPAPEKKLCFMDSELYAAWAPPTLAGISSTSRNSRNSGPGPKRRSSLKIACDRWGAESYGTEGDSSLPPSQGREGGWFTWGCWSGPLSARMSRKGRTRRTRRRRRGEMTSLIKDLKRHQ